MKAKVREDFRKPITKMWAYGGKYFKEFLVLGFAL